MKEEEKELKNRIFIERLTQKVVLYSKFRRKTVEKQTRKRIKEKMLFFDE